MDGRVKTLHPRVRTRLLFEDPALGTNVPNFTRFRSLVRCWRSALRRHMWNR
jgi:hypothetical protein